MQRNHLYIDYDSSIVLLSLFPYSSTIIPFPAYTFLIIIYYSNSSTIAILFHFISIVPSLIMIKKQIKMYNYCPMPIHESGFEELPHTADWQIRVWAPNLPALFAEAARGMNALTGARPAPGPRVTRTFEVEASDTETLLVAFLSELVWATEQENLVFDVFKLVFEGPRLKVKMSGSHLHSIIKTIKAITYHNLQIQKMGTGFQVEIVFDV
jgi:SHS2 domain-containing protein